MANMKFFATVAGQVVELAGVHHDNGKFFGVPVGASRVWDGKRWTGDVQAERRIEFKRNPSLHECDARCQNANGHVCECSCRGKNHGGARFMCGAA